MSVQNKHFLNTPASLVLDSLRGLCAVNPKLVLDEQNKTVYLGSHDKSKVALLCGGGSGHEPAHAGFVGEGILTGAVCGNVFASPNASQVLRGIELVDNDKGTVIIVKNYTGDVLNFGLAKEQYAALHPEKTEQVKFVIVGDDVAVGKTQGSIVGRRGLAGTVLVYKIAGALADRGGSLDDVFNMAQWVASNVVTIGVGLEHCHVPGTAPAVSHLQESEIEIGMGIHNEAGNRRLAPCPPLNELIPQLLDMLTSTSDPERSFLPFQGEKGKDEVVLLVNNLGGISELELGAIVGEARRALHSRGVVVHRVLSGSFMTSLNMPGFSITLLLLPSEGNGSSPSTSLLLSLLDEPADAPGWKWSSRTAPPPQPQLAPAVSEVAKEASGSPLKAAEPASCKASVERACRAVIAAEPEITRMDTIAGDGDCGLTLKAGAEAVLKKLSDGRIDGNDLVGSIITVAQVAEEAMGGTSGALYSIFFSALAQGLRSQSAAGETVTPEEWSNALTYALNKLYTYTRARPPSRTLVDPLSAFVETLAQSAGRDSAAAVQAAASAAERTKDIEAKAGRSAYVEGDRLKQERVADPGAWGVKTILESLLG
ncbi:putative dihydroxyacetone kinase [Lyophyllum shimeji]|uniref:Dihydroxyacetone kinase n=1 Tax=Lyophyllum shimeji TaxID=47721 RepID=A0A9P3PUZ1_LYOSH|nr:putative dihydroxyacetone kinase [Lyophyllum shimeji]